MDPVACWKDIERGLLEGDRERVADSCDTLIGWIEKGGYPPIVHANFQSRTDMLRYLRDLRAVAEMK